MPKYKFEAYDLGKKDADELSIGKGVKVKEIELNDKNGDGIISPGADKIKKDYIETVRTESTLVMSDGTVVKGWYIEVEKPGGDVHMYFIPTDGTVPEENDEYFGVRPGGDDQGDLDDLLNPVPCFVAGTLIATERGMVAVEDLRPGDMVITRDQGLQPVIWIGRRELSAEELLRDPSLKPVVFRASSLGDGMPNRDLKVSPNHRMLVSGPALQTCIGETEALAAAKHLTHRKGVGRAKLNQVTYVHLLFDAHQIVLANGCWSESFCPGEEGLKGFAAEQRREILALFPEILDQVSRVFRLARPELRHREAFLAA